MKDDVGINRVADNRVINWGTTLNFQHNIRKKQKN